MSTDIKSSNEQQIIHSSSNNGFYSVFISTFSAIGAFIYFDNSLIAFFAFLGVIFSGIYLFFDYYSLNRELIFSIHSKSSALDVFVDSENYYDKILLVAKEIAYSCPDAVYRYETPVQDTP